MPDPARRQYSGSGLTTVLLEPTFMLRLFRCDGSNEVNFLNSTGRQCDYEPNYENSGI